jgi:DNA-binding LacI/PurR family transcriptional regulator
MSNAEQTATSSRSDQLAGELRRRIVAGEFAPGQRLPTFLEIEEGFSVSRGVAQIAVERLKKSGFIDPETRQGLFVAQTPPHLHRYGIVFPVTHADPAWSVFDEVLVREAHVLQQAAQGREFQVFSGASDYRESPRVLTRLRRDVLDDRLAGLILTPGCQELADRAPYNDPALPKVFLFRQPGPGAELIVNGDGDAIIDRSLRHLAEKGCRRVAVIRVQGAYSAVGPAFFERHGLTYRPQWVQVVERGDTVVLATLVPLLMDYPAKQRPDGLLVMDDSLVDHVAAAVMAMGLTIGRDLQIVAHSNWPSRSPNVLPIRRIGFHVGDMLARCMEVIDLQRRGQTPPRVQSVSALFEDEVH